MKRLGIITGGGDAPGLNPAIKWVVKGALDGKVATEVIGIRMGWKGLLEVDTTPLDEQIVRRWDRDGGTNIGTARTDPFDVDGEDKSDELLSNSSNLGLDAVVAIGGEDTLSAAYRLYKKGLNVVGIPKTIDKDVRGTDYTLGFAAAVEEVRQLINKLRKPAGSHQIIYVVEIMGRHAGHLALYGGMAGAAAVILIPEYPFPLELVASRLQERKIRGARYDIVAVAEGARPKGGKEVADESKIDGFKHKRLGGIGDYLAKEIERTTGFETRDNKPGHIQRGSDPNFYDVLMGRFFGLHAVELIRNRQYGQMVSLREGRISTTPLEEVTLGLNLVNVETQYDTQRLTARRTASGFPLF